MKIIEQTAAPEYNPEVQVKMTLSELKTIIALVGTSSGADLSRAVDSARSFNDDVKLINVLHPMYDSMVERYLAIPKKPQFQPLTVTIESEEELIALRTGLGKTSGLTIKNCLDHLEIKRNSNEVNKIYNANCSMFRQFDKILEGRVK